MSSVKLSGTATLGDRQVYRLGYGAMQLAGPGVFGPPKDPQTAIRVLQEAVESGVNHIRDEKGNWLPAMSPAELTQAVEDNLRNLGLDVLEVVNLRSMLGTHGPAEGSLEEPLSTLLELKERGLIRHIGLSNVTARQVSDAQKMTPIVCVQNQYNVANRQDDPLIDELAAQHIAWVPFFPLGGFTPLQARELNDVAASLDATPMQVALAWLLQRSPNILLIPGTSSLAHLHENLAAAQLTLPPEALATLDNLQPHA
ncbi:MAG: oxidoreductase [Klebsiella grimontii]|nr:oxidoreductase [Klebsiella grimontii]